MTIWHLAKSLTEFGQFIKGLLSFNYIMQGSYTEQFLVYLMFVFQPYKLYDRTWVNYSNSKPSRFWVTCFCFITINEIWGLIFGLCWPCLSWKLTCYKSEKMKKIVVLDRQPVTRAGRVLLCMCVHARLCVEQNQDSDLFGCLEFICQTLCTWVPLVWDSEAETPTSIKIQCKQSLARTVRKATEANHTLSIFLGISLSGYYLVPFEFMVPALNEFNGHCSTITAFQIRQENAAASHWSLVKNTVIKG